MDIYYRGETIYELWVSMAVYPWRLILAFFFLVCSGTGHKDNRVWPKRFLLAAATKFEPNHASLATTSW